MKKISHIYLYLWNGNSWSSSCFFVLLYSWFTYAVDVVIDVEMGAVANDDEEESLKSVLCKITWKNTFLLHEFCESLAPQTSHSSLHYPLLFSMKWCWKIANIRFQTC